MNSINSHYYLLAIDFHYFGPKFKIQNLGKKIFKNPSQLVKGHCLIKFISCNKNIKNQSNENSQIYYVLFNFFFFCKFSNV